MPLICLVIAALCAFAGAFVADGHALLWPWPVWALLSFGFWLSSQFPWGALGQTK